MSTIESLRRSLAAQKGASTRARRQASVAASLLSQLEAVCEKQEAEIEKLKSRALADAIQSRDLEELSMTAVEFRAQRDNVLALREKLIQDREALEDVIEERVAQRAEEADKLHSEALHAKAEAEAAKAKMERTEKAYNESRKRANDQYKRYHDTADAIRKEVTAQCEAAAKQKAQVAIDSAEKRSADAQAEAKRAILGAECTRINQLNVLCNRLASALSKLRPGEPVLWDYLDQTNQLTGYSGRKDCTDDDLERIRRAHRETRAAYAGDRS